MEPRAGIIMGRTPYKNDNLPKHMRKRVRGQRVYYFLDTGEKPRKEIPLGSDYFAALRKYADLNIVTGPIEGAVFNDLARKYIAEIIPTLAKNTQVTQSSDIKHLQKFFERAPLDQIKPMFVRQFLDRHADKKTTANRCKRLLSSMWNRALGWGYTDLPNPCTGIKGHSLEKRTVYISDDLFQAVYKHASEPLKDAMDLAYLTGQRPADALSMSTMDMVDGHLIVTQHKTKQPLRIQITGKLKEVIDRIAARKETSKIASAALLVNTTGKRMTKNILRNHFDDAREAAITAILGEDWKKEYKGKKLPANAAAIKNFWFYDLRAKAADDTSDQRGEQAASDLLGHDSIKTTQRHYLRRGKSVSPTK